MWVYFSPQRSNNKLDYNFDGNQVEVTYNDDLRETFDLMDIHEYNDEGERVIKSPRVIPVESILSVEKENETLRVTVLNFHGPNPPREVAFPDWVQI